MAMFLEMLRQTGARSGELWRLTWKDIDLSHATITLNNPEKNGLPRQIKVDGNLVSMLDRFPKTGDKLWNGNIHTWRSSFVAQRNRIANKLGNPRIKSIHFHTLRHLYASLLYHKTLNLLEVQQKLGHRNITSTAIYTHLIQFEGDEYNHSIAKTIQEAGKLVDVGFEFVCDYGTEGKLFRKRK
jgi:integrase